MDGVAVGPRQLLLDTMLALAAFFNVYLGEKIIYFFRVLPTAPACNEIARRNLTKIKSSWFLVLVCLYVGVL